jgi:hypothetical protein
MRTRSAVALLSALAAFAAMVGGAATTPAAHAATIGTAEFHVLYSYNPSGDFSLGTAIDGVYTYINYAPGVEDAGDITDMDLYCAGGPWDNSKTWALNGEGFNWGGLGPNGDYNIKWNVAGNMARSDCGGSWKDFDPTGDIDTSQRRPHVTWDFVINRLNGSTPESTIELTLFSGAACGSTVQSGVGTIVQQYRPGTGYVSCWAHKLN